KAKAEAAEKAKAEAAAQAKAEKAAQAKAEAAAKAKAEAAEKAKAEAAAKAKAEAAEKAKAEAAEKAKAEAVEKAKAEAAAKAKADAELAELIKKLQRKVEGSWIRPPDASQGLHCTILVRLTSDGTVIDAEVIQSSGDEMFDNSAINAVNRASPLPVPKDKELFAQKFRPLRFKFNPR
ncbi:cell envelope integrity protein TolA, partial [Methylovulum miyakonense]|uniref:cell envelope integrity protein TolA n=1 Tax=Methylovulum miyakonense TaxID=645578 RepID=UPI00035E3252